MLTLCGLTTGEILVAPITPNPMKQHPDRHILDTCALAMITLATTTGIIDANDGELKNVMHVKIDTYDLVLTEIVGTKSMGAHWLGHPQSAECREEGMVIIQVRCTKTECQHEQTGQSMTAEEADTKVKLLSARRRRDLSKLRTAHRDTNMFQQWILY